MTVGERNRKIVRLHESGMNNKQIAEMIKCSASTAEKIYYRYKKDGEKVFESTNEVSENKPVKKKSDIEKRAKELNVKIMAEEKHEPYEYMMMGVKTDYFPADYNRKIEVLKRTINPGDVVKIGDGKLMTVEEVYPFIVYGHNINNPCWVCPDRKTCTHKCERHASYMYKRMPITRTYVDLLEAGNR